MHHFDGTRSIRKLFRKSITCSVCLWPYLHLSSLSLKLSILLLLISLLVLCYHRRSRDRTSSVLFALVASSCWDKLFSDDSCRSNGSFARLALSNRLSDPYHHIIMWRPSRRGNATRKVSDFPIKSIPQAYNKNVRFRTLCVGDLVLKTIGRIQKRLGASRSAPKWETLCHQRGYDSGSFLFPSLS